MADIRISSSNTGVTNSSGPSQPKSDNYKNNIQQIQNNNNYIKSKSLVPQQN